MWEQSSLEAYNELLFGCLDEEPEAMQQRKAAYDGARRQYDRSDTCARGSCSDSDSGSVAELEVDSVPTALESAVVVAVREGEQVEREPPHSCSMCWGDGCREWRARCILEGWHHRG